MRSQTHSRTSELGTNTVVHSPTHFTPSGSSSTIYLIFVPPSFKSVVSILPPVGTSNHHAISLLLSLPPLFRLHSKAPSSNKRIWLYQRADFDQINDNLSAIDWSSLLSTDPDNALSLINSHHQNLSHVAPSLHGSHVHFYARFRIVVIYLHELSRKTLLIFGLHIAHSVMKSLLQLNAPRLTTFSPCLHLLGSSGLMSGPFVRPVLWFLLCPP